MYKPWRLGIVGPAQVENEARVWFRRLGDTILQGMLLFACVPMLGVSSPNMASTPSASYKANMFCGVKNGLLTAQFPPGFRIPDYSRVVFNVDTGSGGAFTEIVPIPRSTVVSAVFAEPLGARFLLGRNSRVECLVRKRVAYATNALPKSERSANANCNQPAVVDIGVDLAVKSIEISKGHIAVLITASKELLGSVDISRFNGDEIVLQNLQNGKNMARLPLKGFGPQTMIVEGGPITNQDHVFGLGYEKNGFQNLVTVCV